MLNKYKPILLLSFLMLIIQMTINVGYANINSKTIMGMWLMDEGNGNILKDSSGNKNDGTIVGAKWVDGKIRKGLAFDGSSHVEIPASKTIDDIMDGFTYMIWIMPTGTPPNANTRVIERDWHNPTIQIGTTDFYGSIAVNADQSATNVRGGLWAMNEWSFVALTYDGDMLKLYVDSEKVNEKAVGKPDKNLNAAGQGALWLGSWKAPGWNYTGVLDEGAIFNVALSEDDIKYIMNIGLEKASSVSNVGKMTATWAGVKAR